MNGTSVVYPDNDPVTGAPVFFRTVDFTLASGAKFDVEKRGWNWTKGTAPANTHQDNGCWTYAFGAGYMFGTAGGAYGGNSSGTTTVGGLSYGRAYGYRYAPFLSGSPNGVHKNNVIPRGSGSICVFASGHAAINGTMTANSKKPNDYGAPSGGGIWIVSRTMALSPSASLTANSEVNTYSGSKGSGGRISLALGLTAEHVVALARGETPSDLVYTTLDAMNIAAIQLEPGVNTHGTVTVVANPAVSQAIVEFVRPENRMVRLSGHETGAVPDISVPEEDIQFKPGTRALADGWAAAAFTADGSDPTPAGSGKGQVFPGADFPTQSLCLEWQWAIFHRAVVEANGAGSITPEATWSSGDFAQTFTATPADGAALAFWSGDFAGGYATDDSASVAFADHAGYLRAHFVTTGAEPVAKAWKGGTGSWEDPSKWNPAGVPTLDDAVTIGSGTVTAPYEAVAASLTIASGAKLFVGGDGTVDGAWSDIESGTRCLYVNGDLVNAGTLAIGGRGTAVTNLVIEVKGDCTLSGASKTYVYAATTLGAPNHEAHTNSLYAAATKFRVGGALTLADTAILYPECERRAGTAVRFVASDISIAEGASVNADGRGWFWVRQEAAADPRAFDTESVGDVVYGYHDYETLAPGPGYSYNYAAGYGAAGGVDNKNQPRFSRAYGNAYAPYMPGSPNGIYNRTLGYSKPAGGVIWLQATGNMVVDGTLTASTAENMYGQSSGGSVWLLAQGLETGAKSVVTVRPGNMTGGYSSIGTGGRVSIGLGLSDADIDALAAGVFPDGATVLDDIVGFFSSVDVRAGMRKKLDVDPSNAHAGTKTTVTGSQANLNVLVVGTPVAAVADGLEPGYGVASYRPNSTQTLKAPAFALDPDDANLRYELVGYVVSNATKEVKSGEGGVLELTLGEEDLTVVWRWTDPRYRQEFSSMAGGSVMVGGETVTEALWPQSGTTVAATAVPDAGYEFLYWIGDAPFGCHQRATIDVVVDRGHRVTAVFRPVEAATARTWKGPSAGVGDFLDPSNWEPEGIPGANDDLTIGAGCCQATNFAAAGSLEISGTAAYFRLASAGELWNSSVETSSSRPIAGTAVEEAGLVVARSLSLADKAQLGIGAIKQATYNASVTIGGDLRMSGAAKFFVSAGPDGEGHSFVEGAAKVAVAGDIVIEGTSVVYPESDFQTGGSVVFTCRDFTLGADASVDAEGRGWGGSYWNDSSYWITTAPGQGISHTTGGGYGGFGGAHGSVYGRTYGFAAAPIQPGSPNGSYSASTLNRGGGLIRIHATRTMSVAGSMNARGAHPIATDSRTYGGGSGGGIWLTAESLEFATGATLTARGGDSSYSSVGGGGRIAIGQKLTERAYASLVTTGRYPVQEKRHVLGLDRFEQEFPGVVVDVQSGEFVGGAGWQRRDEEQGTFRFVDGTVPGLVLLVR